MGDNQQPFDPVEEASEESFPASDAPAWAMGEEAHAGGLEVLNNETLQRFEATVDRQTAFLAYRRSQGEIALTHAETPVDLEGRGIASAIAHAALEFARENGLKVVPVCPFVAWYIQEHPEFAGVARPDDRSRT